MRIVIIYSVLSSIIWMTGQDVHAQLPDDFPKFTITQNGETSPGYLIGSVTSTNPEVGNYFMIFV